MNAILLDFPEKIVGERIYIRPCKPGDGKDVHKAIERSMQELKAWMPWAHKPQTLEEVEENIRLSYGEFIRREDMRMHIYKKEDHAFIGSTGFHRMNWSVPKVEIGYWIDTYYSGNGYMTEAVQLLTQFALKKMGVNRIEIRCDAKNSASKAIPERLGYKLEAVLRNDDKTMGGELRDTYVYSFLPSDIK
ncbi:GNAT family N-acetyltransferase [Bacillus coahuilensis]|uniref:GNAT family N-acetyltransferase n=1 Tax=Bacillus coahuilensis TaxID=408580 RepID=UPI000185100E|nr:GNAT family N-acetyltransferase [Bacillus coahuilensis]